MTDESNVPIPPEPAETPVGAGPPEAEPAAPNPAAAGPTPSAAWDDVVARLGDLGDALSAWAKAAADTPENREHLDEVRAGVNDMARQANEAFSAMAGSDFGRQVSESASQMGTAIGSSAQEFGQAAAPHVASAFAGLADAFGRAAQKVGEKASPPTAPDPDARPAPEPPASAATPMPPSEPEDDAGK